VVRNVLNEGRHRELRGLPSVCVAKLRLRRQERRNLIAKLLGRDGDCALGGLSQYVVGKMGAKERNIDASVPGIEVRLE